jgi:hypothetical protein
MDSARFVGPGSGACRTALRHGGIVSAVLVMALAGAGCGVTQPLESGPAATISSSSSPSPTPTASLAPTASPRPAPETAAIAAFVKLVAKGNLAYQATFRGLSRHTTTRLPVKGTIAVSGRDYRVTAAFTFKNGTASVDHRYVGGKGWVRFDGAKWQGLTGFKPAASMSPFALVSGVGAVRYLGTKKVAGKTLYQVQIPSVPMQPILIPATNLTKETVTRGILDLMIDEAGRPVTGAATIQGTGRVSGQLQEIVIELNLTFSKVGQRVTVSAP